MSIYVRCVRHLDRRCVRGLARCRSAIEEFIRSGDDDDAREEWQALAKAGIVEGPHGELSDAAKADVARVLETVFGPKQAIEQVKQLQNMALTTSIDPDNDLAPLVDQYKRVLEHNTGYVDPPQAVLDALERGLATVEAEAKLESDTDYE